MVSEPFDRLAEAEIATASARVQIALTTRAMLRALPTLSASNEPREVIELCHGLGLLALTMTGKSRFSEAWIGRLAEEIEFLRPRLGFPTRFVEATATSVDTVFRSFLAGEPSWRGAALPSLAEPTLDALRDAAEVDFEPLPRGHGELRHLLDAGEHVGEGLVGDLADQVLPGREVVEEGLVGDVGPLADLGELGLREPLVVEELDRRFEDAAAHLELAALAAREVDGDRGRHLGSAVRS